MTTEARDRHGGQIVVDQLRLRGVDRVFSVPGESFLAMLDGLVDSGIENVVARHEGGAAMMAEADAKLTGRPGVLLVTRGPGATNAAAGLHVARHDSTPLVAFVGQVPRAHRGRDAFQEVDHAAVFGPLVKHAEEVHDTDRLAEATARAFAIATSGRPGPVVLALPEDVLSARAAVPDIPPEAPPAPAGHAAFADAALDRLARAERPLVVVGGPGWSAEAAARLAELSEAADLPVAAVFRRQDYMDNRHPGYCGDLGVGMNPALGRRLAGADAILALGTRLGDTATNGYTLLDPARPHPGLIHVHPDPDEIGRVHRPALSCAAPAPEVLADLARAAARAPRGTSARRDAARAEYEAWQRPAESPGALKMERAIAHLSEVLPEDAIVTNGAGNYAAWLHRYFRFKRFGTQLAPTSGSMGYGLPAAVAAAIRHPEREVICLAGDGCLQMTLAELSTAAQHGAGLVVLVVNNGRYGTIRMHQERTYPGRVSGTDLFLPDIPTLARAYGGSGAVVTDDAAFPDALARARAAARESRAPAMVELKVDGEALATGQTLSEARAAGEAAFSRR
jgi:acetolactate synthase-1/2/3 large subunit